MTVAVVLYIEFYFPTDNTTVGYFFNFSGGTDIVLASVSIRIPKQVTEVDGGTSFFALI